MGYLTMGMALVLAHYCAVGVYVPNLDREQTRDGTEGWPSSSSDAVCALRHQLRDCPACAPEAYCCRRRPSMRMRLTRDVQ